MAELSWTSEIVYYSECGQDQNWVSITPTQGTSSSSPIVSVKAATSPNDCPRASIIITSNGETQIIPIVRCLPECECKSINFVPNSSLTELPAEGGPVELGEYDDGACVENMQVVTDGIVICEPIIQGRKVTATVQENPSTSPRTGSYKILLDAEECYSRDNIVQEGKVDPCATAVCPTVTPTTMPFESGGGEKTYSFANYDENCWELIGVEKDDWITVNTASTKISVGSYAGTTQRNGSVTFNFVNKSGSSSPCNPSIGITQNKPTPTCDCNDLEISDDNEISSEEQHDIVIGTYTAGCVTNITVSEPATWITSISADNGNIIASVEANTSTTRTQATEITVKGIAGTLECVKSFTLTQRPKSETCTTCNDANIQGLSGGATAEGGTNILIGTFSYSCNPGLTAKRVSGGDFITNMTVSNGKVYGTVSANTATTPRTEDIGIYVGASKCAQYTLTQQGATPAACNIHASVIGHPDGLDGVTFRCGGSANTTGDFSLPSTETGGTISCEKNGFTFKPKNGVNVECGETGQFTVYKDLKITPSITRFNEDSYTLNVPSYEDNLDITLTISVLYNVPGVGPQNYQEDVRASFGETRDEDIRALPGGSNVTNVVIDNVIFDETGESSETVDNSYINYKYD